MSDEFDVFNPQGKYIGQVKDDIFYPTQEEYQDYSGEVYDEQGKLIGQIDRSSGLFSMSSIFYPEESSSPSIFPGSYSCQNLLIILFLIVLALPLVGFVFGAKDYILSTITTHNKRDYLRRSILWMLLPISIVCCSFYFPFGLGLPIVCFMAGGTPIALLAFWYLLSKEPLVKSLPKDKQTRYILIGEGIVLGASIILTLLFSLPQVIPAIVQGISN